MSSLSFTCSSVRERGVAVRAGSVCCPDEACESQLSGARSRSAGLRNRLLVRPHRLFPRRSGRAGARRDRQTRLVAAADRALYAAKDGAATGSSCRDRWSPGWRQKRLSLARIATCPITFNDRMSGSPERKKRPSRQTSSQAGDAKSVIAASPGF